MIAISSENVTIFEHIPGFKFKVRFTNNFSVEEFTTEIMEEVEYNLKFNKNANFTFDSFKSHFLTTNIPEKVKRLVVDSYVLDFTVFNTHILAGTDYDNFGEGLFCTSVTNSSGKLSPELYVNFCNDAMIPFLKPLYIGLKTVDPNFFSTLVNMSKISNNNKCYGLLIRGTHDEHEVVYMPGETDFVDSSDPNEAERLLNEIVGMKATSDFLMNSIKEANTPLANSTRVYTTICNAILADYEFTSYGTEIRKYKTVEWLQKNLRKKVIHYFKGMYHEIKKGKGLS